MATILITGASRGIGQEMARRAAARGDSVIAALRDPAAADLPEGVERHALDATDPADHARLAEALGARAIDILVCNAGIYRGRGRFGAEPLPAEGFGAEDWAATLMTNVAGPFFAVQAFLPHLRRAEAGRIAIISSQMGSTTRAPGGSYIYRAS
ncbi:MAG: SDR family NAD(P)-dependent oxidoreductase, partial [Pseudomonadota bacterium]